MHVCVCVWVHVCVWGGGEVCKSMPGLESQLISTQGANQSSFTLLQEPQGWLSDELGATLPNACLLSDPRRPRKGREGQLGHWASQ